MAGSSEKSRRTGPDRGLRRGCLGGDRGRNGGRRSHNTCRMGGASRPCDSGGGEANRATSRACTSPSSPTSTAALEVSRTPYRPPVPVLVGGIVVAVVAL